MTKGTPALTAQLDLIEWFRTHPAAVVWAKWFLDSREKDYATPVALRGQMASTINGSETVFISKDMCMMIEAAAETLPDIPIQEANLMWKSAFIFFERPILLKSPIPGDEFAVPDAFMKSLLFEINDKVGQVASIKRPHGDVVMEDEVDDDLEFSRGVYHTTFISLSSTPYNFDELGSRLFPYDMSAWTFGKSWKTVPTDADINVGEIDAALAEQRKLLLATNLIAQQYIAVRSSTRATRQVRRRAERTDFPTDGDITYITLRRNSATVGETKTGEGFEYSYRFLVKGHWKHQYYPSQGVHHLIWIHPYIKGDEDLPLIIKDKIYKLVR